MTVRQLSTTTLVAVLWASAIAAATVGVDDKLKEEVKAFSTRALREFQEEERQLYRCVNGSRLGTKFGRAMFNRRGADLWTTCIPIYRPKPFQRHREAVVERLKAPAAAGSGTRTHWSPLEPFCFGRDPITRAPRDGLCSVSPDPPTTDQGVFTNTWVYKAPHPGFFYVDKTWVNASATLPTHAAPCYPTHLAKTRCMPIVIGIGLHKSGTSALFAMVNRFKRGTRGLKEPRFWIPGRGMPCRFPHMECYMKTHGPGDWFVDASVPQTWHIHSSILTAYGQPNAKIIATVRDPLDLLESHYYFSFMGRVSVTDFAASLLQQLRDLVQCHTQSTWAQEHRVAWDPGCFWESALSSELLNKGHLPDLMFAETLHGWLYRYPVGQIMWINVSGGLDRERERIAAFINVPVEKVVAEAPKNMANRNPKHKKEGVWSTVPEVRGLLLEFMRPLTWLMQDMIRMTA